MTTSSKFKSEVYEVHKQFKQGREYCSWKYFISSSKKKQTRKEQYKRKHFDGNETIADCQINSVPIFCSPTFVNSNGEITLRCYLLRLT